MSNRQIILAQLIFLTGCQPWSGQQFVPAAPPMAVPYPMTTAPQPVMVSGQPYFQPGPMLIQPAPQMVPVYPPQSNLVPLPPPGIIPQPAVAAPSGVVAPQPGLPPAMELAPGATAPQLPPNPIAVPVADEEIAWDQIVDVVSDYFTVAREYKARRSGEVWTEGRIETAPLDGATWLEPHRGDSVGSFNRWESTFQTIRRRAVIRVIPDSAGYLVEAVVEKEIEDLPNPEKATAGAATFRTDGSLPSRRIEQVDRSRSSPRWIQLGRDPPLEQRILADIQARLGAVAAGPPLNMAR
jgi:hypothetical protein